MARKKPLDAAEEKRRARLGRQVSDIVNEIVLATADEDLDTVVTRLHTRLGRVSGVSFDENWCRRAVETMRRGDVWTVVIR